MSKMSLSPHPSPLSPRSFGRSGLFGPPLCGGSAPATPPPTTCLIDRVSIFVTGAYSNVSSPTTSRQSHQIPVCAGLVPALALSPTDARHRTAGPGACTASRPKTVIDSSHRWRRFPARLIPPQIWDAPPCAGAPPPQRPRSYSRRSEYVGDTMLSSRGDPHFPRVLAGSEYVPAQASQARQLPIGSNLHHYDHREPATEILMVRSVIPYPDRPHTVHIQYMAW